jgi:RNA polymerase sigma-70 factor (ECF subfamily)
MNVHPQQKSKSSVLFNKVYAENIGFVQFVVSKFRLPPQECDDLVQEVFLRFHKNLDHVDLTKVRAYLATTARNLAIDTLRRDKSRKTFLMDEEVDHGSEETLWRNDPRRKVEAEAAADFIREIEQENEPGAETLVMFYRDGMSVKAIAEKLGESSGTITSRLSRTRQKLKQRLQDRLDQLFVVE